jgi:hypothetical protein
MIRIHEKKKWHDPVEMTSPSSLAATLIAVVHLGFLGWMVWAPFSRKDEHVVMHAVICPFLMLHWVTSSDGCALTLLEKRLRGLDTDAESFVHKIVAPIYVIDDAVLKRIVFAATLGLWYVSLRQVTWTKVKNVFMPPIAPQSGSRP